MDAPYPVTEPRPFRTDSGEQSASAERERAAVIDGRQEFVSWGKSVIVNLEAQIEHYPWPALLLAMGVGYLLARRVR